jgi:hypothetical protein
LASLQFQILPEPSFDKAPVLGKTDLARDVKKAALLNTWHVCGNRSRSLRQGDSEFGKAIINAHETAQALPP